jgi:hypothetical protein
MNHETLIYTKDIKFNSDTEYRAAQTVIDVALSDAQNLYDPLYYSFCGYGEHHIPTAFVLRDLNNVILDFGGAVLRLNGMILLNDVSKVIWDCLEQGSQLADIVKAVTDAFEVSAQEAQADITEFCDKLRKLQLLEE